MRRLLKTINVLFITGIAALFFIGALLKIGIHTDKIVTPQATIHGLSLRWTDKLELQIDSLFLHPVQESGNRASSPIRLDQITRLSKAFSRIVLWSISYEEYRAQLIYTDKPAEQSSFRLESPDNLLLCDITFIDDGITASIKTFQDKRWQIDGHGNMRVEIGGETVRGALEITVADSLPARVEFNADLNGISFHGKENGIISTIAPVVELFELDPEVEPWITERLTGSRYRLEMVSGSFPWLNPLELQNTFTARIRVDDCAYVFERGFQPILSTYTDVTYEKGVLKIVPFESSFYGQKGDKSWLDINFNNLDDILLTAYIRAHAVLNDDMLQLLSAYEIELPIKQLSGKTATDLTLEVHLNEEWVTAKGIFATDDSEILLGDERFHVHNSRVTLENSKVAIEAAQLTYESLFRAQLRGTFDGDELKGEYELLFDELALQFDEIMVTLPEDSPGALVKLNTSPDVDSYQVATTTLRAKGMDFTISPFGGPLKLDNLTVIVPPTTVTSPQGVIAEISGEFSIQEQIGSILCNLHELDIKPLRLAMDQPLGLALQFDGEIFDLSSSTQSRWEVAENQVFAGPFAIRSQGDTLIISAERLDLNNTISGDFSLIYDEVARTGEIALRRGNLFSRPLGDLNGKILSDTQGITLQFADIGVVIELAEEPQQGLSLFIDDFSLLQESFEVMNRYSISSGSFSLSSGQLTDTYEFSGVLNYELPLLFRDEEPVQNFTFAGELGDEEVRAKINNDIHLHYANSRLRVQADNCGFNIPEIISLLNKEKSDDESFSPFMLILDANDSYLQFTPANRAIADSIHFEYFNRNTSLDLRHGKGRVDMRSQGDSFTLEASNLNGDFIGAMAQDSTFIGGKMSMVAQGTFDDFSGLVKIKDTLLKDHAGFNNVMGFLNTVPALVTFSMPEYNMTGVYLNSLVAGARVTEGIATLKAFEAKSPLFDLTGKGWVDFPGKMVDMEINLITRAKTNIRKIPLIGYIIAGEEKRPSVTLLVNGDISDPEVENTMFKEITMMPFSMLYRTLKLPLDLVEKLSE